MNDPDDHLGLSLLAFYEEHRRGGDLDSDVARLLNPCYGAALPEPLANHEIVRAAWDGIDPREVGTSTCT